jgi:DnaA-homolog protein
MADSSSRAPGRQLPLALTLSDHASFATFVVGKNAELVALLGDVAAGTTREFLWLAGAPGTGRSHLLQAACRAADAAGLRAMYLPLGRGLEPELLLNLENLSLLALDDIEAVAGQRRWEERLFPLFNSFYRQRGSLVVAAADAPAGTAFVLPDLASRAAGAVVYRLAELDDAGCLTAIRGHAQSRGLELDDTAATYLVRRVARDMPSLCAWLDRFDRASLAAQRRLTVPFIRSLIDAERSD